MKALTTISLCFFVLTTIVAQNNRPPRMSKEEIMKNKWDFIVEKADLTPANAKIIHPLFLEYENEVWSLMEQNRQLFREARRRRDREKIDFERINEAFVNFDIQKANAQRAYYQRLKRVISAEVIYEMFNAERIYRQRLIQRIPERPRQESANP